MPRPFRILAVIGAVAVFASSPRAQERGTIDPDALRARIELALAAAPGNYEQLLAPRQAGVRVQAVDVTALSPSSQRIAIDLSQRALTYDPSGNIEPLLDQIIQATAAPVGAMPMVEYRFTV